MCCGYDRLVVVETSNELKAEVIMVFDILYQSTKGLDMRVLKVIGCTPTR